MHAHVRLPVRIAVTALGVAAVTTLAACGTSDTAITPNVAAGDRPAIVASTNVWGSVAEAVAGDRADVTSIISDPSADPHSYEASPADAAAVSSANLVVFNGGGYDEFMESILSSSQPIPNVDAFSLLGEAGHSADEAAAEGEAHSDGEAHSEDEAHSHSGGTNEHVWYDPELAAATAEAIATQLGEIDPDNATYYTDNAEAFHDDVHEITDITDKIAAQRGDAPVAQTEPIAFYLLEASGVDDRTPEEFTSAIEEGNDPSPASIAATRDLFTGKSVDALVYNVQTSDGVTEDARRAAEENDIPVVEVTETLPDGMDYVTWQRTAAQDLADALGVV